MKKKSYIRENVKLELEKLDEKVVSLGLEGEILQKLEENVDQILFKESKKECDIKRISTQIEFLSENCFVYYKKGMDILNGYKEQGEEFVLEKGESFSSREENIYGKSVIYRLKDDEVIFKVYIMILVSSKN